MNKMVEVQSININDMVKNGDGTYRNEIILTPNKQANSKNLASESELHRILLHLNKKPGKEEPEKNKSGYTVIPSYFTLEVGKNVKRYNKLIDCNGELTVSNKEYALDENGNKILDENNHYQLETSSQEKYVSVFCGAGHSRTGKNLFVQIDIADKLNDILLCGIPKSLAYGRPSKWNAYYAMVTTDSTPVTYMPNIVVIEDYKKMVRQKADIVEISGIGANKKYNPIGHKGMKRHKELLGIMPFDGAGLVTPECALKWARELNCQSSKKKFYLPSCFQFRALPGIKGEAMVFDLKRFAREKKVSKIVDLGGKVWDIFKDKIDVVLTKSQFKFWEQYLNDEGRFDYHLWRNEFDKECHGYKRTFNIVSYGVHPKDLSDRTMLGYQPGQSLNFTDEEIREVSGTGIDIYRRVMSNVDDFLKYRRLIETTDGTGERIENIDKYTPPYYVALLHNKSLFYDQYVHGKIEQDIKKLKNNILSGKIFVRGNYQVFIPDLYGLAEWAFHDELGHGPQGLLKKPYHIYSDWWNDREAMTVDIMRNPAVGMEHRVGHLRNNRELKKWFKFQTTGIVTGMYDTLALALNGADYDGDIVCTTDNIHLVNAVKREFQAGNGRLVVKKIVGGPAEKEAPKGIQVSDRAALMKVNQMSFKNSIGHVIDRVTDLWTYTGQGKKPVRYSIKEDTETDTGEKIWTVRPKGKLSESDLASATKKLASIDGCYNEEIGRFVFKYNPAKKLMALSGRDRIRGYIMIGVIVGGDTIDFAKTGENASFPYEVVSFLKGKKRGWWMRYLPKYIPDAVKEEKAVKTAILSGKPEREIEEVRKFIDYGSNMDRLCHYAEKQVSAIGDKFSLKASGHAYGFDHRKCMLRSNPRISRKVFRMVQVLQKEYQGIAEMYRKESLKSKTQKNAACNKFRWFYEKCRTELLFLEPDINKLIDMLVVIYYGDKNNGAGFLGLEKDILWNAFPGEMIARCTEESMPMEIDLEKLEVHHRKNVEYAKKRKDRRLNMQKVTIGSIQNNEGYRDKHVVLTKEDRKSINDILDRAYADRLVRRKDNVTKLKRILAILVYLGRKCENEKGAPQWMKKLNNIPNEITDLALERLTAVNHKYMDTAIALFDKLGILESRIVSGGTKIKVLFPHNGGEAWFGTEDYNKAGTMIRDYFRCAKGMGTLGNGSRERDPKIS